MKASVIAAMGVLAVAFGLFFSFPNRNTYLFAPGLMLAYMLNGGVHGKSPLGWGELFFALASVINLIVYWLVLYLGIQARLVIMKDRNGRAARFNRAQ